MEFGIYRDTQVYFLAFSSTDIPQILLLTKVIFSPKILRVELPVRISYTRSIPMPLWHKGLGFQSVDVRCYLV